MPTPEETRRAFITRTPVGGKVPTAGQATRSLLGKKTPGAGITETMKSRGGTRGRMQRGDMGRQSPTGQKPGRSQVGGMAGKRRPVNFDKY